MYNLEFAAAHKTFEAWQELHPDDPLGAASNAAAYLFTEFDRMHVLELSLFTDYRRLEESNKLSPDPQVKAAFDAQLSKADEIADKALAQASDDRNALFAKVLSDGLRADYKALVEKRTRDGLGFLKLSRTTAEKLISIDPDYHDAYLALGIENYVLGIRSAPMRWMLRLSGADQQGQRDHQSQNYSRQRSIFGALRSRLARYRRFTRPGRQYSPKASHRAGA